MTTKTQPLPTDKELEAFAIEEEFLLFCDVDEFTQIACAVLSLQQNAVMDKVIDKDRAAMAAKKGDTHD